MKTKIVKSSQSHPMGLTKANGYNDYTWRGLTLGKLIAIKNALYGLSRQDKLSSVNQDTLLFLEMMRLEEQEEFATQDDATYDGPFELA